MLFQWTYFTLNYLILLLCAWCIRLVITLVVYPWRLFLGMRLSAFACVHSFHVFGTVYLVRLLECFTLWFKNVLRIHFPSVLLSVNCLSLVSKVDHYLWNHMLKPTYHRHVHTSLVNYWLTEIKYLSVHVQYICCSFFVVYG